MLHTVHPFVCRHHGLWSKSPHETWLNHVLSMHLVDQYRISRLSCLESKSINEFK